ncbi:MAG: helix-hairpin-helix domain-containing protein [Balneolaceae bacterium]|nr:helix-hairpin-helix domain-containing protein [Balneolaceae bacterium]MDR9407582.1 helix-hairpin-helix domain-containing protein [Balneolaceae bacterium]
MKRRLFFLIEKLEIKRSERIAISILFILMVILSGIVTFNEPNANYSEEKYAELEKVFKEKSEQIKQEEQVILARYMPERDVPVSNSLSSDNSTKPKLPDTTDSEERRPEADKVININTANKELLQELPGVGPAYSERIINWREENGPYTTKDQLLEIKGIGDKRLARIKPLITLR